MTSNPASRSARATIFAPRSWPSSPGLATTTRILRSSVMVVTSEYRPQPLSHAHDGVAIAGHQLPVESAAVALPAGDQVEMVVGHGLEGGGAIRLQHVEAVHLHRSQERDGDLLGGGDGGLEVLRLRLEDGGRVRLRDDEAVPLVERIDVHDAEGPVVLVDLHGGDGAVADLAEDAVRRRTARGRHGSP